VTSSQDDFEEPDHQKVEVAIGGNVQLHCPKGKFKNDPYWHYKSESLSLEYKTISIKLDIVEQVVSSHVSCKWVVYQASKIWYY
jgi:hypothetical protein